MNNARQQFGNKRVVCFVITSDIHYTRNKLILDELKSREDVELQVVLGGAALLPRHSSVEKKLKEDGFSVDAKITMLVEGGNPIASAKTAGLGVLEFATVLMDLKPDVLLLRGDRYEMLSAALAALHLNIPIAHIEGGEVSGTIDESVRHALTKLSHIHFTTNENAKKRVERMGENPEYVFNVGSPDIEYLKELDVKSVSNEEVNNLGVGGEIDLAKPYILVLYHPVATEYGKNKEHTEVLLHVVNELGVQALWFWPNTDTGTDEVMSAIRRYHEQVNPSHIRFLKYIDGDAFSALLRKCACLVGNSSAGIKEGSYLGTPIVNIGSRQQGRTRAENVIDVAHDKGELLEAIKKQIDHGVYPPSSLYMKEGTAKNVAEILATKPLYTQKIFHEE